MKNSQEQDEAVLREALHDLAERGVPSANVQGAVRRKLREGRAPVHSRPRALRWAAVMVLAGLVLIGVTVLPAMLSQWPQTSRVMQSATPTAHAGMMPRIVQASNEIGSYVLSTTLPASPESLPAFQQVPLPLPTLEDARRIATQFNMQGEVFTQTYRNEFLPDNAKMPAFLIIDGARRLSVNQDGILYSDTRVHVPAWTYQQDERYRSISRKQQLETALAFLTNMGVEGASVMEPDPLGRDQTLMFRRVLSGTPVSSYQLGVDIDMQMGMSNTQVAVGSVWLPRLLLEPANRTDSVVDAMTAYGRLAAGTHVLGGNSGPAPTRYNPIWTQQFRAGQWASLEGLPQQLTPMAEPGNPSPQGRIELKGIRLDLSAINPTPTLSEPVWAAGNMRAEPDGELVLHVERWERGGMPMGTGMTGTIEISGTVDGAPFALLRRLDGEAFFLPNAPDDLPNGVVVGGFLRPTERRVNGFVVAAWQQLEQQDMPLPAQAIAITPEATPAEAPQPTLAVEDISASSAVKATALPAMRDAVSNQVLPQGSSAALEVLPVNADGSVETLEGWLQASLVQDEAGKLKRVEAFLSSVPLTGTRWFAVLSGPLDVLSNLATRDGTRVRIWGRALSAERGNTARIEVTRFERVDPAEEVRAWLGQLITVTADGQTLVVMKNNAGERFVLASSVHSPESVTMMSDMLNRWFIVEGVLRPEQWAGMYVIQDQGMRMSRNDAAELQAYRIERPQIIQETSSNETGYVERVELVYLANLLSRRLLPDGTLSIPDALSTQVLPAWRFSGRTSAGREFVTFVDARVSPAK